MAIDFTLSETQLGIQASARDFAQRFLAPTAAAIDRAADPWDAFQATREAYREMAHAGFTKCFIPESLGGLGFSMVDIAIAAEELSQVELGAPSTMLASGLGLQPILQYGTDAQQRQFIKPFVDDNEGALLASLAFTDTAGGANYDSADPAGGMKTMARLEGDTWVINGQKHYTSNGAGWDKKGAHLFTVVCRIDSTKGADEALAVIAVPGNTPGIEVVSIYDKLGQRGICTPAVTFRNVRVPKANLIGTPGAIGKAIVDGAFAWTAALIGGACVGVMKAAFRHAFAAARDQKKLGAHPVIEHQTIGYRLVDMKMGIEAARYLTWKGCHDYDVSHSKDREAAIMTKVYASEMAVHVVQEAMRVVGIDSYIKDSPMGRLYRDVICFPLYDGSNDGVRRKQLHGLMLAPGYDAYGA
ncbi:MAG: acyl-CoA dehydrogenase [Nevskiaceae bacterium]|nr:MAG: acyl-CoA dehydrogenase [Nevskiaceae bacterium]TBR74272.1 MAG: acyl-CoA dehydrogenase [Nevskiaceae bacterium]